MLLAPPGALAVEEMGAWAVVGVGDTALVFLGVELLPAPSPLQDTQKGFVSRKRGWSHESAKPAETGVVGSDVCRESCKRASVWRAGRRSKALSRHQKPSIIRKGIKK